MKGAEVLLLSGVEASSLNAIEQHTDNAYPIDYSVCNKLSILLNFQGQPGSSSKMYIVCHYMFHNQIYT